MLHANPMDKADTSNRLITDDVFLAHLQCPYKAYLKLGGHSGTASDYERFDKAALETYRLRAIDRMLAGTAPTDVTDYAGSFAGSLSAGSRFLLHGTLRDKNISSHVDVLEKVPRKQAYAPVIFSALATISSEERLLLGFKSLALSAIQGKDAPYGKIVHGSTFSTNRLALPTLRTKAASIVAGLANVANGVATPRMLLNRHCNTCEFRSECRAKAIENDDLSLIQTLKPKDIAKLNRKGIFTVTQYAFTFRPRRKRRKLSLPTKHNAALKALAIREQRIYVNRLPARDERPVQVFLDVEGLPNEDLYYLIGLSVHGHGDARTYSFWADDKAAEEKMWKDFLGLLSHLGTYWIFHFGSYESRFIARMLKAYGTLPGITPEDLQGSLRNILTHYHLHIYVPTYSNGLKDVAGYFGFSWTSSIRSGAESILWRRRWEAEKSVEVRDQLVVYNREDCEALKVVTEAAISLLETSVADRTSVTPVDELKPEKRFRWGRNAFGVPAFEYINKCAYFDYQQAKIYWRTSASVQQSIRRREKRARRSERSQRPNTTIRCFRPTNCVACISNQVVNHGAVTRTIHDLRFSATGVRRWLVRYVAQRYKCQRCNKVFYPAGWPSGKGKYGRGFNSWIVYQSIGLRQSHGNIISGLNDIFGWQFQSDMLSRIKEEAAAFYLPTYVEIERSIRGGGSRPRR
jgi:predicted RecB family nuclease